MPPCYFGYSLLKDRFGDANRLEFMVRNGEQNFAEIIIPIKKSFLQSFGAMKEFVVSAFCCANIAPLLWTAC
jgi:hypothetical protein